MKLMDIGVVQTTIVLHVHFRDVPVPFVLPRNGNVKPITNAHRIQTVTLVAVWNKLHAPETTTARQNFVWTRNVRQLAKGLLKKNGRPFQKASDMLEAVYNCDIEYQAKDYANKYKSKDFIIKGRSKATSVRAFMWELIRVAVSSNVF
ncbi:unnamed protein product [Nippostrongylus brasiliensis]|uniref:Histone H1 n=1 Tax=Nippostrongylus brasiliensis TaxID=27835 RepID=A0A158R2A0_NIPBR|nr:unnamed protein product [Nippostrongylus brasiliensis]